MEDADSDEGMGAEGIRFFNCGLNALRGSPGGVGAEDGGPLQWFRAAVRGRGDLVAEGVKQVTPLASAPKIYPYPFWLGGKMDMDA